MSYLHLTNTRTRTRDRTPSPRPLIRRDTKRSRTITLSDNDDDDDDLHDDYPYSSTHRPVKPSRALTVRNQPSQLERYNIWSDRHVSEDRDDEFERERETERVYRHTSSHHHHDTDRLRNDPEERAFRLNVAATFSRPHLHHSHHHHHHDSSPPVLRRKEKFVDEGWETRERSRSRSGSREISRRDSFWGDGGFWGERKEDSARESEDEVVRRWRKVKRTKTEEWRPLSGWRTV